MKCILKILMKDLCISGHTLHHFQLIPAGWATIEAIFDLVGTALFGKSWLLVQL